MIPLIDGFRFAYPWLLLLLLSPVAVLLLPMNRGGASFAPFPLIAALPESRLPLVWRLLVASGLAALVIAAARPQFGQVVVEREQTGRDLVLVIDTSHSMAVDDIALADGTRGDRLAAVFGAAKEFVAKRPDDRIGLVFFATNAVTSCPLTYDHHTITEFIDRTEAQQRERWEFVRTSEAGFLGDATNIGLGLGHAIRSLRDKNSLGKAIILITDGADSRELPNWVDPLAAARLAATRDATIYGIGVGNPAGTMTAQDRAGRTMSARVPRELLPDMARLTAIVSLAGGLSFPANDRAGLAQVLERIDQLQPTPHKIRTREDFSDRFALALAAGCALLALAFTLEPRLRGSV